MSGVRPVLASEVGVGDLIDVLPFAYDFDAEIESAAEGEYATVTSVEQADGDRIVINTDFGLILEVTSDTVFDAPED